MKLAPPLTPFRVPGADELVDEFVNRCSDSCLHSAILPTRPVFVMGRPVAGHGVTHGQRQMQRQIPRNAKWKRAASESRVPRPGQRLRYAIG